MGRSRGARAAASLLLGCVLSLGVVATGVPGAAAPAVSGWTSDRIRVEPVAGSGVSVGGLGEYRGAIELVRTPGGLAVVNEVGFEDYVKGISEVPSSWPAEALKAQAIAARTYALWEYRRSGAGAYRAVGAHICATESCQVYVGLGKERSPGGDRWRAAVDATRGQVLWWRNGPIVAKYSSSNGGESVPGGQPYLRAVRDPDDAHSPLHQWQVSLSPAQVAAAVGLASRQVVAIARSGDLVLVTARRDPTDLAEEPEHLTLEATAFRDRINATVPRPPHLPRTLPTVRFEPSMAEDGSIVVSGRGWGHGIGLSQWGAFGKAMRGLKAPDILAAYYGGLRPIAVPEPHVPVTIKVALALDAGPLTVAPVGEGARLRISDSAGTILAHGAAGAWRAAPGSGDDVDVVPSPADAEPATVVVAEGTPPSVPLGAAFEVRLTLPADALVTARAVVPGRADPVALGAPTVFRAGELRLTLPGAEEPGPYTIVVDTDRGGGVEASTTIEVHAVEPVAPASDVVQEEPSSAAPVGDEAPPAPAPLPLAATLASALLAAVAARAARTARGTGRVALGPGTPRPVH